MNKYYNTTFGSEEDVFSKKQLAKTQLNELLFLVFLTLWILSFCQLNVTEGEGGRGRGQRGPLDPQQLFIWIFPELWRIEQYAFASVMTYNV